MIGLSWLGFVSIASLPSLATVTNAQPEPNWRPPAALKSFWNFSMPPRSRSIAASTSPSGLPPLAHDFPEHGVVGMAAEIVADGEFDAVVQRVQIAEDVLDLRRSQ